VVMPRSFSSLSRSVSTPVSALTRAVLPWSMWPAVPRMTCRVVFIGKKSTFSVSRWNSFLKLNRKVLIFQLNSNVAFARPRLASMHPANAGDPLLPPLSASGFRGMTVPDARPPKVRGHTRLQMQENQGLQGPIARCGNPVEKISTAHLFFEIH